MGIKPMEKKSHNQDRSSPLMRDKELERLRVRTWFFHLVGRAIGAKLDYYQRIEWEKVALDSNQPQTPLALSLQRWLDRQSAALDDGQIEAVTRLTARNYHMGLQSPRAVTLGVFEALLPGSQEVYDLGPTGEPLWSILDGNLEACRQFLDQSLPLGNDLNAGTDTRIQAVMDALIAPDYRLPQGEIPELGKLQMSAHPAWLTRVNEIYRTVNEIYEPGSVMEIPTVDDQIIAALALWQVCAANGDGPLLRLEWLLVGLCYGLIADVFGEEVQAYVLARVKSQASQLDAQLKKRGATFMPFEERWKTVIALAP
jgi:hypothetical protein